MQRTSERWEVVPFEAVGPLRFGMSKAEVAATLGEDPDVVDETREAFDEVGCQTEYGDDGRLESVTVYAPAVLVVRGVEVHEDQAMEDAVRALEALGQHGREHQGVTWFEETGTMLYGPTGTVEGAGAYRKGYDTGL